MVCYRQGHDGHPKKSTFLTLKFGSPINWCSKPHKNHHNGVSVYFRSRLTLKMRRTTVKANRLHSQGIDGRPQKGFAYLTLEYGSPKKNVL